VKRFNHRDLTVKDDVQSSLHPFQGKWHCAMQPILACHNMLPSTTVTAAWSFAMRSFDCPGRDSIIRCLHVKKIHLSYTQWTSRTCNHPPMSNPPYCMLHSHTHQTSFHRSIMLKPQTLPQSIYNSKQSWYKSFQRTMITLGSQPVS